MKPGDICMLHSCYYHTVSRASPGCCFTCDQIGAMVEIKMKDGDLCLLRFRDEELWLPAHTLRHASPLELLAEAAE